MEDNSTYMDNILQSQGFMKYDLTLENVKKIAQQQREPLFFNTIPMVASNGTASASITTGTGNVVLQFTQQYINSFVQMDPIIEWTITPSVATTSYIPANTYGWITSLGATSRASNNLIPSSLQDQLHFLGLAQHVYDRENINVISGLNGQNVSQYNATAAYAAAAVKVRRRLSDFFGGQSGLFSRYLFIGNDQITYKIGVPQFTSADADYRATQTAIYSVATDANSRFQGTITVSLYQNMYKIPGPLQLQLFNSRLYFDYLNIYRIPISDKAGTNFNIQVNQSQFQAQLEGLAIFFTKLNATTEDGKLGQITGLIPAGGATSASVVKNWENANKELTSIQIKNGQNIILDLQTADAVSNYFLQQNNLLPVQNVNAFNVIYLSKNIVSQYSNQILTIFSVKTNIELTSNNNVYEVLVYAFGRHYCLLQGGQLLTVDSLNLQASNRTM